MFSGVSDLNWKLIIILLAVSCIVAFIGDVVGMRVGKKRISIFGLRPKYTSSIITVLSGLLIMLFTLGVLLTTSQTVRTAILSMKIVQRQITDLTAQLQDNRLELESLQEQLEASKEELLGKQAQLSEIESKLKESEAKLKKTEKELKEARKAQQKAERDLESLEGVRKGLQNEIKELQEETAALKRGLEELKEGRIIVFSGEVVAQKILTVNPEGWDPIIVEQGLIELARRSMAFRAGTRPEDIKIQLDEHVEDAIKKYCKGNKRYILRLVALENTVRGKPIPVELVGLESQLIYKKGDLLAVEILPAGLDRDSAERYLYGILRKINTKAKEDGVLPDPIRGTVGNLDALEFFNSLEKIENAEKTLKIKVEAAEDIYTEGPVRVKIRILPLE
ncbi:DUF3084 domain-containing protein [Thermovirga sp.]|uniref:DUF3084 domain-containing protein n=1 Tax=Thermovirga sp. TaxID=2699834 RepID=UPI0025EC9690|nr:DUF3084 domain-containing protein [Thermovirga sp.]MBO8153613.1 DUF3084 domain-containing protein [Thermovirga sp.]